MKLILKNGVDWSGKYGFEDIGRTMKAKRIGDRKIYIYEIQEGQYGAHLWQFERTLATQGFLGIIIAQGDARIVDETDGIRKGVV